MRSRKNNLNNVLDVARAYGGRHEGAYLLGASRDLLVQEMFGPAPRTNPEEEEQTVLYPEFYPAAGGEYRGNGRWVWTWITEPAVMAEGPTLFLIVEGTREEILAEFDSWQTILADPALVGIAIESLFLEANRINLLVKDDRVWYGSPWPGPRRQLPKWSVLRALAAGAESVRLSTPLVVRSLLRDLGVPLAGVVPGSVEYTPARGDKRLGTLALADRLRSRGYQLAFAAISRAAKTEVFSIDGSTAMLELLERADHSLREKLKTSKVLTFAYPDRITEELWAVVREGNDPNIVRVIYELGLSDIRLFVVPLGSIEITGDGIAPWAVLEALRRSIQN